MVKRVFRTISMNGIVVNNVLYLELIVDRLKELTYPEETGADPVSFEKTKREIQSRENQSPYSHRGRDTFCRREGCPFPKGEGVTIQRGSIAPTGKQSPGYPKRYLRPIAGRQIQRLLQRLQQKVPKRIQQKW